MVEKASKIEVDSNENSGVVVGSNLGSITLGMSYKDVKELCYDIVSYELLNYKREAEEKAKQRLTIFSEELIEKLSEKRITSEKCLEKFKDPSVLNDVFEAEKSYIKRGTKELKDLLINVIDKRLEYTEKDNELLNIVLSEAIKVAPKLTNIQYKILSLGFIFKHVNWTNILNKDNLVARIITEILPILNNFETKDSDYQHLVYTGCGTLSIGSDNLISWFRQYDGIFSNGLEVSELENLKKLYVDCEKLLQICINDHSKKQFAFINKFDLEERLKQEKIDNQTIKKILQIYGKTVPNDNDLETELITMVPKIKFLFDYWKENKIKNLQMSSVGIVIGAENLEKELNQKFDLSIWI